MRRIGEVVILLAVLGFGAWLASSYFVGRESEAPPIAKLEKANALAAKPPIRQVVGTSSCAGRGCHGSLTPSTLGSSLQTEFVHWLNSDPHENTYRTLEKPESAKIVERLGLKTKAYETVRCLACHTNPRVAADTSIAAKYEHRQGIGCEACHGGASGWIEEHLKDEWKNHLTDTKWKKFGMVPVRDTAEMARRCAGCHVGAPEDCDAPVPRDVDHDLIAAGHPRLMFEFTSFFANLPPHWREPKTPVPEPERWATGQLAVAECALELLEYRLGTQGWPDLAEYSCASCHHEMGRAGWPSDPKRRVGSLRWSSWYLGVTASILSKNGDVEKLQTLLERSANAKQVAREHLDKALAEVRKAKAEARKPKAETKTLNLASVQTLAHGPLDRDRAVQLYLSLFAFRPERIQAERNLFETILVPTSPMAPVDRSAEFRKVIERTIAK